MWKKGKIKLKYIKNRKERKRIFKKRRKRLGQKAIELGKLTGCSILLYIERKNGNTYHHTNCDRFEDLVEELQGRNCDETDEEERETDEETDEESGCPNKKMFLKEVLIKIFKENPNKEMTTPLLYDIIKDQNLFKSRAKKPKTSIYTTLSIHKDVFEKVSHGIYKLK